ncbi:hypothetical protein CLOM_g14180 [Closterium sp. NIES-68]|nr:hypothetical protein CLOM_g14180 [Closterium sp. NIES-68]
MLCKRFANMWVKIHGGLRLEHLANALTTFPKTLFGSRQRMLRGVFSVISVVRLQMHGGVLSTTFAVNM